MWTMRELTRNARDSLSKTLKIRKDPDDTAGNSAAKRLIHTVKRSLSSSLTMPHQVEKLVSRYVLLGFEELVKDEGVLASTTLTSIRMLLSSAIDRWSEPYTVFTTGVSTAFLDANMKYGIAVCAKPPLE